MNSLHAVLISCPKPHSYIVHSVHADIAIAAEWAACKEHDGDDTCIALITPDVVERIVDAATAFSGETTGSKR